LQCALRSAGYRGIVTEQTGLRDPNKKDRPLAGLATELAKGGVAQPKHKRAAWL